MTANYYSIIMAGGGGTRLWPLSRRHRPKQLLRLFDEKSLFQIAVDRLLPIMPPEQVFVVTIEAQAQLLQPQAPMLPAENFIMEPAPRGTASVIGLAATILHGRDPDCVMAALTADHYISHVDRFQELLLAAYELACEGDLVTLGISPSYAETGYGYIRRGESRGRYRGYEAFHVGAFKEKPTSEQAQAYISSGEYAWNSGMFVWKAARILEEI
jgi:mannose-1-phosphate guanylyltransferase